MKMKEFIERHQLAAYFGLAYGISWGGTLLMVWLRDIQVDTASWEDIMPLAIPMLAGPFLTGILLTALLEGKEGLKGLLAGLIRWRVKIRWYIISILTNPLVVLITLSTLALLVSPVYRPSFNPSLIVFGIGAGFFEEIGWTGFATPRILRKTNWLSAAIGLGVLHGFWHLLADFLGSSAAWGPYWLPYFLVFWVGSVAAYRVLMVWVYRHTHSLLLGILMHTVFTGGFYVFMPTLAPSDQILWGIYFSASLWFLVAILTLSERRIRLLSLFER